MGKGSCSTKQKHIRRKAAERAGTMKCHGFKVPARTGIAKERLNHPASLATAAALEAASASSSAELKGLKGFGGGGATACIGVSEEQKLRRKIRAREAEAEKAAAQTITPAAASLLASLRAELGVTKKI